MFEPSSESSHIKDTLGGHSLRSTYMAGGHRRLRPAPAKYRNKPSPTTTTVERHPMRQNAAIQTPQAEPNTNPKPHGWSILSGGGSSGGLNRLACAAQKGRSAPFYYGFRIARPDKYSETPKTHTGNGPPRRKVERARFLRNSEKPLLRAHLNYILSKIIVKCGLSYNKFIYLCY